METLLTVPPLAIASLIQPNMPVPIADSLPQKPRQSSPDIAIRPADSTQEGIVTETCLMDQASAIAETERVLKPYGIEMLSPRDQMAEVA